MGALSVQSQARAGVSAQPRALQVERFQRAPQRQTLGAAGRARVCPSVLGTLPFPGAQAEPSTSAGSGDPFPPRRDRRAPLAHFAKARKRPSPRQRNSTSSTPGPSARPRHSPAPSLDPATSRVDTSEKGGGPGCQSAPRCRPAGGCPGDTPPAAPPAVPGPRCGHPGPNRPPPLQRSDRGARRTQSGSGCARVESAGGSDPAGARPGRAQLFTRFLPRSPRCRRR